MTIHVRIIDPKHPHYGETGEMTGKVIKWKHWRGEMAEVKLDNCKNGTDACFVNHGQVCEWEVRNAG